MRSPARLLAVAVPTVLAVTGLASPAHAASPVLISSSPAVGVATNVAPASVVLTFDQAIAPTSTLTVTGPAGSASCPKDLVLLPDEEMSCTFTGQPAPTVPGGTYTVSYTAQSTSGDPAASGSFSFDVDRVAPAAPSDLTVDPDPYNSASTTLTVTGSSEAAGDTVTVALGGTLTRNATAGAGGAFEVSFDAAEVGTLDDGPVAVTAHSTDRAGNEGPAATGSTTKDVAAPTVVSSAPAAGGSTGSPGFHYGVTASEPLGAASTVAIFDSTSSQLAVTEEVSGSTITVTPVSTLPEGEYVARIRLADLHGNVAAPVERAFSIDDATPAAPQITAPLPNALATNAAAFPVSGTGEASASVTVRVGDTVTGTATVGAGGAWSTTVDLTPFPDGPLGFSATQTDGAGHTSPASETVTTLKDTAAPGQAATLTASPSPYLPASTALTVAGTTAAGDSAATDLVVDVTVDDVDDATAAVRAEAVPVDAGSFSVDLTDAQVETLSDGSLTVSAVVRDTAGNQAPARTAAAVKDTTVLALAETSPADGASLETPATISATYTESLDAGTSTITVRNRLGVVLAGSSAVAGDTITFTPASALSESGSPYAVTVHAVDPEDSGDVADDSFAFTVDNTAPAAPVIAPLPAASRSNVAAFPVSGTGEAGASVALSVNGTQVGSGIPVANDGSWGTTLDLASYPDGTLTLTATQTDAADHVSPPSAPATTTKNTAAVPSTTTLAAPALVVHGATVTLSGKVTRADTSTAAAAVRVTMRDEAGQVTTVGTATLDATGAYRLTHTPTVNATYTATYLGDPANAASTSVPAATQVAVHLTATSATGPAERKARVKGTVTPIKAGTRLQLFKVKANGARKPLARATVKPNGRYVFKLLLPEGTTRLKVRIKATPGNAGNSVLLDATRT